MFEKGLMAIYGRWGGCTVWSIQIITILYSSRHHHVEGRQIERANGSQGNAVWSNLVLEVWQLREWQGEKELLIHNIKKERYHFTLVLGVHLQYMEDRCSAGRFIAVTMAPRLYWNDCKHAMKAALPSLCSVISKENALCCWVVLSLDTRCECQPQDKELLVSGKTGVDKVKILSTLAQVQWPRYSMPWLAWRLADQLSQTIRASLEISW